VRELNPRPHLERVVSCPLDERDLVDPLRLCPHASVPSDVVPRCTGPGQGRAHPAPHTPIDGNGVHGHSRSGADDESRTRGLGHGVAALCLLSYIRNVARRSIGQYRLIALRQLVKEPSPWLVMRSIDRASAPKRWTLTGQRKRPGSFGNPGLRKQSLEGVRLGAPLSRMHWVLRPIQPAIAGKDERPQADDARTLRPHRSGARERDPTQQGPVCSDDVKRFHG
jgi:hypothetical protein